MNSNMTPKENFERFLKTCKLDGLFQSFSIISYMLVAYGYTSFIGFFTFFGCLFSPLFFLAFGYIFWYYSTIDHPFKGGYDSNFVKRLRMWKWFCDYFPIRMHKTCDIDPKSNYIFAVHPTGILNAGTFGCFGTNSTGFENHFPGITPHLLIRTMQFNFPLTREILLFSNACVDDRRSMEWVLNNRGLWSKKGQACIVNVASNEEVLDQTAGKIILSIKSRKDFIRASLQTGALIVPVFAFGEENLFEIKGARRGSLLRMIQEIFTRLTIFPFPLLSGSSVSRHIFGFIPLRKSVDMVIGKPIEIVKVENPTIEEVNRVFEIYQNALENLFYEHKNKYLQDKTTVLQFR
jgi:2-acylglycerol O-acyltransferase 2